MTATPIPVVVIGAGQRGARAFASYALRKPEEIRVVAIAEPNDLRRNQLAASHQVPYRRCFRTWEELLDAPLMGDVVLVCTPDLLHFPVSKAALEVGYHVVLDIPIASSPSECLQLVETAEASGQLLITGHGLRYTAFYRALHDIVVSGRLGEISSYQQERTLPSWLIAHQFLRGSDWHTDHNPMLFLEGVHEFDLILWMLGEEFETVSSVGVSRSFRLPHAPVSNAPSRCVQMCPAEQECSFSALGTYLEKRFQGMPLKGFPYTALANGDESESALRKALEEDRWGECVYHYNTELVDHQTVQIKHPSGVDISLVLNGQGEGEERTVRIEGSQGSLVAEFKGLESHITVHDHARHKENRINFRIDPHSHGGDHGLMGNLAKVLRGEAENLTLASRTVNAHLLAFAAEEARRRERAIRFASFRKKYAPTK